MIPQLSSNSSEWYGPDWLANGAMRYLGGRIAYDPFSCPIANRIIGAEAYSTASPERLDARGRLEDGYKTDWSQHATLYINPPGGSYNDVNSLALAWYKLQKSWCKAPKPVHQLKGWVFVVFNLELIRHAVELGVRNPLTYNVLIPEKRIRFDSPTGTGPSPAHPSIIVADRIGIDAPSFSECFGAFGECLTGAHRT